MTNFFYLYDKFFVSNRNFTTQHVKIVKNFRFLSLNCQIPGFSRLTQVFWQPCNSDV